MNKLSRNCVSVSVVLFFGFIGLYVYVWVADPNPKESPSLDWRSVSIGHWKITIAHSLVPSTRTNGPAMLTYPYDGGGNLHITITKDWGGRLILLNQCMPSEGVMLSGIGDDKINVIGWRKCGIYYSYIIHTIEKDKNWWTLMISLWYPIIIFGIVPFACAIKRIYAAKS
jgi:hypothetical protein